MHWLAFLVSQCGKDRMPSQIFKITRAPEADPINPRQVRRMISVEREDSECDVQEYELHDGKLVRVEVARMLREKAGLDGRRERNV